jgi:selenocysteine lyase/cysteine desulfurase
MQRVDRSSFLGIPDSISINHCGISPTTREAVQASHEVLLSQACFGNAGLAPGSRGRELFRNASANLLQTSPENISFVTNSALGLNIIAHGFPFAPGDEILSYRYEYPSNHYPWKLQEARGAKLVLMDGELFQGSPLRWDLRELESLITPRTRMVAISHVQFVSGFAADLAALGALCRSRGIALVVDGAQSIGCMPVYPEKLGIDALVTSGWKWLMGPIGSGCLYTSPSFRAQLKDVLVGPDMMSQGSNYLDHSFNPVTSGARFEFSTIPYAVVAGLGAAIQTGAGSYGIEQIWDRIRHLQRLALNHIDSDLFRLIPLAESERSGILSFSVAGDPRQVVARLEKQGIRCSARGPEKGTLFFRVAPHFYLSEDEVIRVAHAMNQAASDKPDLVAST